MLKKIIRFIFFILLQSNILLNCSDRYNESLSFIVDGIESRKFLQNKISSISEKFYKDKNITQEKIDRFESLKEVSQPLTDSIYYLKKMIASLPKQKELKNLADLLQITLNNYDLIDKILNDLARL